MFRNMGLYGSSRTSRNENGGVHAHPQASSGKVMYSGRVWGSELRNVFIGGLKFQSRGEACTCRDI